MSNPTSPFRHLAKTYASELISREHYVLVRGQLLKKLQSNGVIGDDDLQKFIRLTREDDKPETRKTYTPSDWVIIALGIAASIVLGFVLYG